MLHRAVLCGEPFAHLGRLIVKRSHPAAIDDVSALIDNVKTLWPSCVRVIGRVVHVVDAEGQGKLKPLCEILRDSDALRQRFWLRVANIIFYIGFHLPFIRGMRLANVDGEEVHFVFVVVVNLYDVAHLAAERRSSEAAKHQHQRPRTDAFANVEVACAVKR